MQAGRSGSALLVPMLRRWQGLLQSFNPLAPAILRISSGAAYITRARAERVDVAVGQLLGLCQAYLIHTDMGVPETMVRAKILLEISRPYAGLLLRLRYYGDAPTLDHAEWVRRELGSSAVLLEAAATDRMVTLGALLAEPERELPLIHVRAGDQPVALPMATVAKAQPAQEADSAAWPDPPISLAHCLGLTVPGSALRPACLLVKTPAGLHPLQVEALEGHGQGAVMSPGPLFLAVPWCLGFIHAADQAPVPVIEPWLLLKTFMADSTPAALGLWSE